MKTATALVSLGLAMAVSQVRADGKWDIAKFDLSKLPPAADTQGVTFDKDIRPLFEASCTGCHGDERQKGGLRLDSLESTLKGGKDGKVVVSGDSGKSLLVAAAAQIDDKIAMPPKHGPGGPHGGPPDGPGGGGPPPDGQGGPGGFGGGPGGPGGPDGPGGPGGPHGFGPPSKPLTSAEVGLIRAWIDQGVK